MVTEELVRNMLTEVLDPEIQIDIVNLGMVYNIDIEDGGKRIKVTMTLTTMGCPLFDEIKDEIVERLTSLEGVEEVDVSLTFDPPWDKEMMSDEAKLVFKYLF
ncbi:MULTISPECIES: metal-sulfur cluster assembly factor [Alicyclobacillus]|uniref:Metal-sulfur cluster assembly factor n=1 Tax=Alicyclobacillus acidoterrestris (strain ATCC 49025 / DSM 3922 / CIP 106132 / NCIMB 13137 / GD3B) TaxID=1356854 RepID=T0BUZ0_ALIAG|nr:MULTISPECIES: metal-sulfur cluster assembly factor [Alicyclobacillus]EPZ44639.1 aromatic ring hydroxylating enzyme [Alicyclobacillus acidoterrestris ATCC 49025]UNO50346.1 metal-sulfur cluster assembly factor [Alicyclobacillus acidoterrestris]GEO25580.1 Fe-S assembly SUF system protein [Alicyclobacillus acidoterrestris]